MTWKQCTPERYEEQLGCLPPRVMSQHGFMVGEPSSHRRCTVSDQVLPDWAAFVQVGGQYYEGPSLTMPEWRNLYVSDVVEEAKAAAIALEQLKQAAGPLRDAVRAALVQLAQGKILPRDAVCGQLQQALDMAEGRAGDYAALAARARAAGWELKEFGRDRVAKWWNPTADNGARYLNKESSLRALLEDAKL